MTVEIHIIWFIAMTGAVLWYGENRWLAGFRFATKPRGEELPPNNENP